MDIANSMNMCLSDSEGQEVWHADVHGVAKSQT